MPICPVSFNLLALRLKYATPAVAFIEVSPPRTAPLAPVAATEICAVLSSTRLPEMSRTSIAGWFVKAIRLAAPDAAEAMFRWCAAPNVMVTDAVAVTLFGLEIVATRLRAPTKPVSFTPLPTKSATPALDCMVTIPPMVASGLDKVTVCAA